MGKLKKGYYYLIVDSDPEPVLVHGYKCSDMKGEFGFGFNTYDGGGFLPLSEVSSCTKIVPVSIVED